MDNAPFHETEGIRLNKFLSESGVCSRREADRLIEAGEVLVDGKRAVTGMRVLPFQRVCCRGKQVEGRDRPVLLAVYKPRGIVCTTSDKDRAENIVEFLNYPIRIYPVGRLDKDSEGLILMTNQGELSDQILRARNGHEKEYEVTVDRPVSAEFIRRMGSGVEILDTVTRPCRVEKTGERSFRITLTQGLNRQIRRMCSALGFQVRKLKRVRIMNIMLGRLKAGEYREVSGREWEELSRLLEKKMKEMDGMKMRNKKEGAIEQNISEEQSGAVSRIRELVALLREAGQAYYQESREIMSNYEYDRLYDELARLEEETGVVFGGSPTQNVGYEVLSALPKERHESPMLSLNKTKSVEELAEWLGDQKGVLSWKMDGLTIVLTYEDGVLVKAVTRGNGEIGEVITNNARVFANVPLNIAYRGQLILRGEAVIRYSDFERLNEQIEDADARYKNPRNLCSGSVRQLNNEITAQRNVCFFAFSLVKADGVDFKNSRTRQFLWLRSQGFEVVEYKEVTRETLANAVEIFSGLVEKQDVPSDGLVLIFDDIEYGRSLGRTAKFPRDSIAFKWADEIQETTLSYIEWSASRTGLINPVAVFEPVELEGTTVSRASVHNISIMESLELGVGDRITVYKANMIIPQIADNLTKSGVRDIPKECPVCGGATEIRRINDVKSLYCANPDCQAKKIKSFTLFTSRDALNIGGLSEATLEKFIGVGFIHEYADLFHLDKHEEEIVEMEGFGRKSFDNLMAAAKKAADTTLPRVVYSLGIAGIGLANAKMLCRHFKNDFDAMRKAGKEELVAVDGIGEVLADAWIQFFSDEKNNGIVDRLMAELTIAEEPEEEEDRTQARFAGMNFVITGSLERFKNRKEMQELIEKLGGRVTGSVTAKTNYLINNDTAFASSKNKKAKELGVTILSEEAFLAMLEEKEGGGQPDAL